MMASVALGAGAAVNRQAAALYEMMRAVNAGDAAAYARIYAEDAVITIHGGDVLSGRRAIEAYEVDLLRQFPGTQLAFFDFWQNGVAVVVHYGVDGRTPSGRPMGHEGLLFYRFDPSGLIKEERRYLDSATPMAQLGLLGPSPVRARPTLPGTMLAHIAGTSPREERNAGLVRSTFAALDAGDEAAFLAAFAEDGVLDDLSEPGPSAGKPGVKAWFEGWTHAAAGARTEIATLAAIGDDVLVETVVRGRLHAPLGRLTPSDRPFAVHRAAIVQMKDDKIAHLAVFMNTKELAQAVGQWPPSVGAVAPGVETPDAAAATAVRAVLAAQVAAWNRGDLEGYMAGYWRSPDLVFFSNGQETRGWQATLDRYRARYQGSGQQMGTLDFPVLDVLTLGPESAVARGRWRLKMADGKELTGMTTVVFRKLREGWRIVHDHSSADVG